MVEFINRHGWSAACAACWALAAMLLQVPASAGDENLPDPTRPANVSPDANSTIENAEVLPQLQSILISPYRKVAVISGQTLHIGEKFAGATLIKITAHEVVLKNGTELKKLKLYPDIEKRKSLAAAKSATQQKDY
jgi:MSHA biogenesis protein MshK